MSTTTAAHSDVAAASAAAASSEAVSLEEVPTSSCGDDITLPPAPQNMRNTPPASPRFGSEPSPDRPSTTLIQRRSSVMADFAAAADARNKLVAKERKRRQKEEKCVFWLWYHLLTNTVEMLPQLPSPSTCTLRVDEVRRRRPGLLAQSSRVFCTTLRSSQVFLLCVLTDL